MKPIEPQVLNASLQVVETALFSVLGSRRPSLAFVLGSGWSEVFSSLNPLAAISYQRIPALAGEMNEGHAGELRLYEHEGVLFLAFCGRVHYYQRQEATPLVAPVWLSHQLGVRNIMLTNAVGGISTSLSVGDFVILKDLDSRIPSPLLGFNQAIGEAGFIRHTSLSDPFSNFLKAQLRLALQREYGRSGGSTKRPEEGVLMATQGPHYETSKQIELFRSQGFDVVGMSTFPEVEAANSLSRPTDEIHLVGLALVTNQAARPGLRLSHTEVEEEVKKAIGAASRILLDFVTVVGSDQRVTA